MRVEPPRMRRSLGILLVAALAPGLAGAEGFGCALPVDPFKDAGPPNIHGLNGPVTTPLAYDLDEGYGDAVDIGTVWLKPTATTLEITMQVRDLDVAGQLEDGLRYDFTWSHPDAPPAPLYETWTFPVGVYALYTDGSWRFTAGYTTARGSNLGVAPIPGSVDVEANIVGWQVPIDPSKSGARMTELFAYTAMGPSVDGVMVNRAVDQSDQYGGTPWVPSDYPRIEFDLTSAC